MSVQDKKTALEKIFSTIQGRPKASDCQRMREQLQDLDKDLQTHIHTLSQKEVRGIIGKLDSDEPLNADELEFIKMWLVGDAGFRVEIDQTLSEWLDKLNVLMERIRSISADKHDYAAACNLRVLTLDAIRLIRDIEFFIKQEERIRKFTDAAQALPPEEKNVLIQLLEGKMFSEI